MRTLRDLAINALQVQDCRNLCGVATSFSYAMRDLEEILKRSGDVSKINEHPICKLWAKRIYELSGMSDSAFKEASNICEDLIIE